MKVKRRIESDVDTFNVEDVIEIELTNGTTVQAMAVKQDMDNMIFCMVDCLPGEYPMNNTNSNNGGYEDSYLRKKLNGEILNIFPVELKEQMVPFENHDLLRLPTEYEIFGENVWGERESDVKQWEPMKKRRNRMAFDGTEKESLQWYWLTNKARNTAATFAIVAYFGGASYNAASTSLGVRPAFKIINR